MFFKRVSTLFVLPQHALCATSASRSVFIYNIFQTKPKIAASKTMSRSAANKQRKALDIAPVVIIDSSSGKEEKVDNSMETTNKKRKKMSFSSGGENSTKRGESKMCHLCKKSEKERVLCCSKCKDITFCLPCIKQWYSGIPEENFLRACPVCRNLCDCIECLPLERLPKHLLNIEVKCTDEIDFFKHFVRELLPALEQFDKEQMIEKQIESQIRAFPDSRVFIRIKENEKNKIIYCNYCNAFILDYHRSCSSCSYKLCLTCCKELRNSNLQEDASEVRMQNIDNGPGYLPGKGCSLTSAKSGTCAGTAEVTTRDQTEVAMASKWKPMGNGAIPCPPKDTGGCSEGTLYLRCRFPEYLISELLLKAQKCNSHINSELHYYCSESEGGSSTSGGNLRKAAARENFDDNYVFSPTAVDTQRTNSRHFQLSFSKGEPVIVTNVHDNTLRLRWEPTVIWTACRQTMKAADVLNCSNWCEHILSLYKGYIDYGFPKELGRGNSVTKLHYALADTVNILMHTQAVIPTVEQLVTIRNLRYLHKAQDKRKFIFDANRMHESIKTNIPNANGKSVLNKNSSNSENKKTNQHGEDSRSLFGQDKPEGFEEADGALWDVFRRQDVPKLEEYLRKHFREFTDIHGSPFPQVVHLFLDNTFYLSTEHKRRLKEEYGIEPWTFFQNLGDAVFVPAGCPHQVRKLKSCINVALDFISVENVNVCIRLTEELRKLPKNHHSRKDKWQVRKAIVRTMIQAVNQLEKILLNSEAGIGTELCLASSISKSINAMPGPSMPRSSSVSEYPSSSMAANREEYAAPNEDEEPRTAELILHSPLPVVSTNKAQASTSVPSQALTQFINIEDVESTFHTVSSFLKSLPKQYPSQQSSNLSNSTTSSAQITAKMIFERSIRLPLEAFAHDATAEKEMYDAIATLTDNPSSLFSEEQAKLLLKLKYEFPFMVKKCRELAQSESSFQELLNNFDEDKKKLDDWIRSEAMLKANYEKREEQAQKLEALLQDIRTSQKGIMDEREEGSREAQKFVLLAQEKAGKIERTNNELVTTKIQVDGLRKYWSNLRPSSP